MPENDQYPLTPVAQCLDAMLDQSTADSPPLELGQNRDWGQRDRGEETGVRLNMHPAEQNVSGDSVFDRRDDREKHRAFGMQSLDKAGFVGSTESSYVDGTDFAPIFGPFCTNVEIRYFRRRELKHMGPRGNANQVRLPRIPAPGDRRELARISSAISRGLSKFATAMDPLSPALSSIRSPTPRRRCPRLWRTVTS